mmetsp:Transcript_28314/g.81368  ORF Transcript_28314/g.81368 Transcript_28314/m.81368 type:complete len:285 (+) Transcript_28314:685-1539(+)
MASPHSRRPPSPVEGHCDAAGEPPATVPACRCDQRRPRCRPTAPLLAEVASMAFRLARRPATCSAGRSCPAILGGCRRRPPWVPCPPPRPCSGCRSISLGHLGPCRPSSERVTRRFRRESHPPRLSSGACSHPWPSIFARTAGMAPKGTTPPRWHRSSRCREHHLHEAAPRPGRRAPSSTPHVAPPHQSRCAHSRQARASCRRLSKRAPPRGQPDRTPRRRPPRPDRRSSGRSAEGRSARNRAPATRGWRRAPAGPAGGTFPRRRSVMPSQHRSDAGDNAHRES